MDDCEIKKGDRVKLNGMGQPMVVDTCGTDVCVCCWTVDGTEFRQPFLKYLLVKCR